MSALRLLTPEEKASLNMPDSTLEEYAAAFAIFDQNCDGSISTSELATVVRSLGLNPTPDEIISMMDEVDTDKSGRVEFVEFCFSMKNKHKSKEDVERELMEAFLVFDRNKNGFIDSHELHSILIRLGEDPLVVDKMMSEADIDGDRQLNYHEFVKYITGD